MSRQTDIQEIAAFFQTTTGLIVAGAVVVGFVVAFVLGAILGWY